MKDIACGPHRTHRVSQHGSAFRYVWAFGLDSLCRLEFVLEIGLGYFSFMSARVCLENGLGVLFNLCRLELVWRLKLAWGTFHSFIRKQLFM